MSEQAVPETDFPLDGPALREVLSVALAQLDPEDVAMRRAAVRAGIVPSGVLLTDWADEPPVGALVVECPRDDAHPDDRFGDRWVGFTWALRPLCWVRLADIALPR